MFFLVCCCPPSPFPNFKPHSSHTGPLTVPLLPTPAAVLPIAPPPPSVCISCLVSSEVSPLVFTPSRVTGLQAMSPKRSLSRFSPGYFSCSESGSLALTQACLPTDRHEATINYGVVTRTLRGFLVLDVLHSLDPHLHHSHSRSRTPKWAYPLSVCLQSLFL